MKKIYKIILIAFVVLAIGIASYLIWHKYFAVRNNILVLYGNVDIRQVDLGFRVGGRIKETLAEEGDLVDQGQPLAKLETDLLTQQKDYAIARLGAQKADLARLERGYRTEEIAQAKASVAVAMAVAENAATSLHRVTGLRASNAISQKELDNARAKDSEAKARLRSARDNLDMLEAGYREEDVLAQKAQVEGAAAELRRAEIQLADSVLYAPQKGIILTKAREAGAIVGEGQTIYTLTLNHPVWLRAYVSEPNLGKIKPGMKVKVAVDAVPDKTFPGFVGFISPTAEFTPKTVETTEVRSNLVYRLRIQVQDPENVMRQGMPVTIYAELEK